MVRALEARAKRDAWPEGTVKAQVMDSTDLSAFPDDIFSHTYMAAAIFIVPDPVKAIAEIRRTLKPGGVALVTSFEKHGFLEIFQDAQRAVRPEFPVWKGPLPEEWLTEGKLRSVVEQGGFEKDKVEIKRYSSWMKGEEWTSPTTALFRELFTRAITEGWTDGARAEFEERLVRDLESQRVKETMYEMKVFVAVTRK
jgi:ubiquinone/menaquinone biosynthesis C-methylase UbiE